MSVSKIHVGDGVVATARFALTSGPVTAKATEANGTEVELTVEPVENDPLAFSAEFVPPNAGRWEIRFDAAAPNPGTVRRDLKVSP